MMLKTALGDDGDDPDADNGDDGDGNDDDGGSGADPDNDDGAANGFLGGDDNTPARLAMSLSMRASVLSGLCIIADEALG